MNYLVGMLCGGIMECPDFDFSDPVVIITDAPNKKEALDFYNKKFHCNYFYGDCIGEIKNGKLFNISDDISKNKANSLFHQAKSLKFYNIIRNNKYLFYPLRQDNNPIEFWDSLSDLEEILHKDLMTDNYPTKEGNVGVWDVKKRTCIGYTNLKQNGY